MKLDKKIKTILTVFRKKHVRKIISNNQFPSTDVLLTIHCESHTITT